MSIPDAVVQFGFDSDPTVASGSTTWTDVSDYVNELPGGAQELLRTVRGKQYELDEFQAGTLQLVLDNRDGRFSPDNTASPYWPNLKPMRRVRVLADGYLDTYSDVYGEPVWSGFVDEWPQQWLSHAAMQVTVAATDGFKVLHNNGLQTSVYAHEVAVDEPAHWWRLGESSGTVAVDQGFQARKYDGTYSGSPTLGASGLIEHDPDTAVELDGVNDALTVDADALGNAAELVFTPASLPGAGTEYQLICGPYLGQLNEVHVAIDENGQVKAYWQVGGSVNSDFSATGAITAGGKYHLLFTTGGNLYINGSAVSGTGSISSATDVDESVSEVVIGGANDPDGIMQPFHGTIDEVAFYALAPFTERIEAHAAAVAEPWDGDLSGARIGRALDIASWPDADRDLDAGVTAFQDGTFADDDTVLAFVQRAQRSEYGYFYIGPDSDAVFIGRHNLLNEARYTTSQATFSDQPTGSELPYTDLQLDPSSDATVVNDWTVQRKFGTDQNVFDVDSISEYFERSQSRTALMMDTDAEARAQAEWLLAHTKDPVTRIRRMTLDPSGDAGLWEHVLGRELMDRVTVNYRIPGGGTVSKEVHIIGIEHRVSKGRWMCDWWLSPADTQSYLILDDATFGLLGANRLGY